MSNTTKLTLNTILSLSSCYLILLMCYRHNLISDQTIHHYLLIIESMTIILSVLFFITFGQLFSYLKIALKAKIPLFSLCTIALVCGIVQRILVTLLINLQLFFGFEFNIGSNQAVLDGSILDIFFLAGVFAPLYEEFLFRVCFFFIAMFIYRFVTKKSTDVAYEHLHSLKHPICILTLLMSSILFSFVHGPDLSSFHVYALGGLTCGILYVKHGYLSAVLAHFSFNFLSLLILPEWLWLIN